MTLLASVVSVGLGFSAGIKWEKADRYEEASAILTGLTQQYADDMSTLNGLWESEAARARIQVEAWNVQNQVDADLVQRLLQGQSIIRSKFDEINDDIRVLTDLGICTFSPDAVSLLREASHSTTDNNSKP